MHRSRLMKTKQKNEMEPLRQVHSFPTKWSKQPLRQVQHYQKKKKKMESKFITQPFHQV